MWHPANRHAPVLGRSIHTNPRPLFKQHKRHRRPQFPRPGQPGGAPPGRQRDRETANRRLPALNGAPGADPAKEQARGAAT